MSRMEKNSYPVYVDQHESSDLCIQEGWYIGSGDSITVNPSTGNPFGSENEVIEHLENGELSASH